MQAKRPRQESQTISTQDATKDDSLYVETHKIVTDTRRLERERADETLNWIDKTLRSVRPDSRTARRIQSRLAEEWRNNHKLRGFSLVIMTLVLVLIHSAFSVDK